VFFLERGDREEEKRIIKKNYYFPIIHLLSP
jgi:hypothetical protein